MNYLDPWGLMVGFGYMGGPSIGIGAGGIPGLPPDISGGGISQPGAVFLSAGISENLRQKSFAERRGVNFPCFRSNLSAE